MGNWTIGKRIFAGFGAVLAIMAVLGTFTTVRLLAIRHDAAGIVENVPMQQNVVTLATGARDNMTIIYRHIGASSAAEKKQLEDDMKAARALNSKALEDYEKAVDSDEARSALKNLQIARDAYGKKRTEILKASNAAATPEATSGVLDKARTELLPLMITYTEAINTLWEMEQSESVADANAINANSTRTTILTIVAVVLSLTFGIFLCFGIVRSINKVLHHVSTSLGDGARQVVAAATQVASASQSLAQGASEQAASIEETSASIEEMSSVTLSNADNADRVNALARQARDAAEKGAIDMKQMSESMIAIQAGSDDIGRIIKTIDEIAFQTNILALNAAVEAARAGEAGRGFAVVAEEVRGLAQRSANAARESATKVSDAISRTNQGVEISSKVAHALNEIVTHARGVDELAAAVASASRQQSQGITQVNTAVGQMDRVTQSNAAGAEESASAAEELNAQAESMRQVVGELEKLVGVNRVAPKAVATAPQRAARRAAPAAAPRQATTTSRAPARAAAPAKPARAERTAPRRATHQRDQVLVPSESEWNDSSMDDWNDL
jgi:methyl-accepting chemotaxis protein